MGIQYVWLADDDRNNSIWQLCLARRSPVAANHSHSFSEYAWASTLIYMCMCLGCKCWMALLVSYELLFLSESCFFFFLFQFAVCDWHESEATEKEHWKQKISGIANTPSYRTMNGNGTKSFHNICKLRTRATKKIYINAFLCDSHLPLMHASK